MSINRPLPRSPLSLAVLSLLYERPMHPYEMKTLMAERGHDRVLRLKGGSLYDTVERLLKSQLIQAQETSREGRRPERTVYAITDSGRDELRAWMRQLVAEPAKEFPIFASALAFLLVLNREEVLFLLARRRMALEAEIAASDSIIRTTLATGLFPIVVIEEEYAQHMRRAEVAWVGQTIAALNDDSLHWPTPEDWAQLTASHSTGGATGDSAGWWQELIGRHSDQGGDAEADT